MQGNPVLSADCERVLENARRLHSEGRRPEAAALYGELLTSPRRLEALQSLGRISFENGDLEAAQYFLGEALRIAPDLAEELHLRGVALMRLGQHAAALGCLEHAIGLAPHFNEAILNHATLLLDLKRPNEALAGFDRLLCVDPDNPVVWNNRGNALVALGRFEEGAAAYDRALALDPGLEAAQQNRFYARLTLRKVDRISAFAAREAFDRVAQRYDQMVLHELSYCAHEHLCVLASRVLGELIPPFSVLDLGCGTGLAGECFKDAAKGGRLDGVDISPLMIEEARKRGIYDRLIVADFQTFLAAPGPSYRLMLSADALVYLGDLSATFAGVARRLEPGGTFLFTCEAKKGDGWELTEANRFRHSEAYLRTEAHRAGLSWLDLVECMPRMERRRPVEGFAIALGRPLSSP
jgi:predicted TPR repeat methyltransferase